MTPLIKIKDISILEKVLGYKWRDSSLINEALTHKSFSREKFSRTLYHNERLEFLGDSVLGLIIVEHLYKSGESYPESTMSKLKAQIVKEDMLYEIAMAFRLGDYLRIGKGEETSGGRNKKSILSDALEALIGAVYIDGGMDEARRFVLRHFEADINRLLEGGLLQDYKTILQEETQKRNNVLPEYKIVSEEGMEHDKLFNAEVVIEGEVFGIGRGKSKKEAETLAAKAALEKLRGI